MATIKPLTRKYRVTYDAAVIVEAKNEDEALYNANMMSLDGCDAEVYLSKIEEIKEG
jgi:hypothetical protein